MQKIILLVLFSWSLVIARGQTAATASAFMDYQKAFPKFIDASSRKLDTLMKQFEQKNLEWPAKYIYIRSFKYDSQLEVWVRNETTQPFKLFKPIKSVHWPAPLVQKEWRAITRFLKDFIASINSIPKAITIFIRTKLS
jgi:murein L,D-transpeptidase YafK